MANQQLFLLPTANDINYTYALPASNNGKTYKVSMDVLAYWLYSKDLITKDNNYTLKYANKQSSIVFNGAQGSLSQIVLPNHNSEPIVTGTSISIANNSLAALQVLGDTGVICESAMGNYIKHYGLAYATKIENNKWILSGDLMNSNTTNWPNAKTIVDRSLGTAQNGIYTINGNPTYCLMDTSLEGGGWMLAMKATRNTTFSYSSSHWTSTSTLNPSDTTRNDADAKYHIFNTYIGTQVMAIWPDVGVVGGSLYVPGYGWIWKEDITTPSTLLTLFQTNKEISSNASTFPGLNTDIWSTQSGYKRYGFNMSGNLPIRWGFIWNNENNSNSSDVSGGIGMSSGANGYSAGDWYSSAGTQGLNRSMRVEIYIR